MRLMSFALTEGMIRCRAKSVTRRLGWRFLKPGDLVLPVKKAQGLKRGERAEPIGPSLRIVSVRRERLLMILIKRAYGQAEVRAEGFGGIYNRRQFVRFFCQSHSCEPDIEVTRIEFEYVEGRTRHGHR